MPTSRATRVTSSAKLDSWSTIVLIVSASAATSPLASTVIFLDRSPSATAVVTSAMPRTWSVRLAAMTLTDSVRSRQVPDTPLTSAWPPSLPSVPTSRATRVTSSAKLDSWSTIVFTVVPMRRNSPLTGWPSIVSAILRSRSPSATASSTLRHLGGGAHEVVDQRVERLDARLPASARRPQRSALVHAPLAPDHAAHARELLLHAGVHGHQLVVGRADLSHQTPATARQATGEVSVACGHKGLENLLEHGRIHGWRSGAFGRGHVYLPADQLGPHPCRT